MRRLLAMWQFFLSCHWHPTATLKQMCYVDNLSLPFFPFLTWKNKPSDEWRLHDRCFIFIFYPLIISSHFRLLWENAFKTILFSESARLGFKDSTCMDSLYTSCWLLQYGWDKQGTTFNIEPLPNLWQGNHYTYTYRLL